MIKKSCPYCSNVIEVTTHWYEDPTEDPTIVLHRVLASGDCMRGNAFCSGSHNHWRCNPFRNGAHANASHVTPVTPCYTLPRTDHIVFADVFGTAISCGYVNGSLALDAVWLVPGLARCVQYRLE